MAYIGNQAATAFTSFDKQIITGNNGTVYTLSHAVASEQELEVFVNNVRQEGGAGKAFTVSGNQITFTGAVTSNDSCYVNFQGKALQTVVPPDGSVSTSKLANGSVTAAKLAAGAAFSAGMIMTTAAINAPSGWLLAYGQAVTVASYGDLYAAIGSAYNTGGEASGTFRVPDLRGRVVAGQDDMGGTSANRLTGQTGGLDGDTLGASGGTETQTLSIAQLPSHNHNIKGGSGSVADWFGGSGAAYGLLGNNDSGSNYTNHISFTGSGAAHNNVQPTFVLNYIIKT